MSTNENAEEVPVLAQEVNRVGIRVPKFWPEKPLLWFNQLEAQFLLNGITVDATKFYYIMSQLEPKYAVEVEDILENPPATNKYETLKRELIVRLSASQSQQIRQLLEQAEIGDRTPSQFLRHMRSLAGTTVNEDFLRTLWASRLPNMTRAIVTAQTDIGLNKLAEIADQIHEGTSQPHVASVVPESATELLLKRLESLELQISELSKSRGRSTERRYRPRSQSRNRERRARSPSGARVCWYHHRFGNKCRPEKCTPPCNYNSGNDNARH